jgi:hypothetical protein
MDGGVHVYPRKVCGIGNMLNPQARQFSASAIVFGRAVLAWSHGRMRE